MSLPVLTLLLLTLNGSILWNIHPVVMRKRMALSCTEAWKWCLRKHLYDFKDVTESYGLERHQSGRKRQCTGTVWNKPFRERAPSSASLPCIVTGSEFFNKLCIELTDSITLNTQQYSVCAYIHTPFPVVFDLIPLFLSFKFFFFAPAECFFSLWISFSSDSCLSADAGLEEEHTPYTHTHTNTCTLTCKVTHRVRDRFNIYSTAEITEMK